MTKASRRGFLAGAAALPLTATAAQVAIASQDRVAVDLAKYIGFGNKQAGGAGDNSSGAWLASELEGAGYAIERLNVSVPYFDAERCELVCGDAKATLWAQPIVVPTGIEGATGPLVRVDANGQSPAPLTGAIALIDLPFSRWSSTGQKAIREPIVAAFAAGAQAVIAVTNGPTGKVIALNADGRKPMFAGPVALLAPQDARPFFIAAARRDRATVYLTGSGGRRPAFNFVGRIDRGKGRWLVVSTPRSGWYGCAGERGSGIAAWLWLARWASKTVRNYNLAFICNTGHEYEYLGAAESLRAIAPNPAETHFWLHVGASFAARDWHDATGQLLPLPSVDAQRYLAISPSLLPIARSIFAGHLGFEVPYSSDILSAGELTEISAAGYKSVAGVFGAHRFHHVADDDDRCVSAASVAHTTAAFQQLLEEIVRR